MSADRLPAHRHAGRLAVSFLIPFALAACEGTAPETPAAVEVVAGAQSGAVASLVDPAPTVRVRGDRGTPLPGVEVRFEVELGGGSVSEAVQHTDRDGVATVAWTLGSTAGPNVLAARVVGTSGVRFEITTEPGPPAALRALSAADQIGTVGSNAPTAPVLRVVDAHDNGVPGVTIVFDMVGGGSLAANSVVSGAAGQATPGAWQLGTVAGEQRAVARIPAFPSVPALEFRVDARATNPIGLRVLTQPGMAEPPPTPLSPQPVVALIDSYGNIAKHAASAVTAFIIEGRATLSGTTTVPTVDGVATFTNLAVTGSGVVQIGFTSPNLPQQPAQTFRVPVPTTCNGPELALDLALGEKRRFPTAAGRPGCLRFDPERHGGREYLITFEYQPELGPYPFALFPGESFIAPMTTGLRTLLPQPGERIAEAPVRPTRRSLPEGMRHAWDFGRGPIYELDVKAPAGVTPQAQVLRGDGTLGTLASGAAVSVGDTLVVGMEGIERLGILPGPQKAVVRFISNELIFAEDVRLADLPRGNGGFNSPLTAEQMQAIAHQYTLYGARQLDRVFRGRHNGAVEQRAGNRSVAVHSVMARGDVWGYTYMTSDYFVYDFWVGTDGRTPSWPQQPQRVADNLFTHEVAHMRHAGELERAGLHSLEARGNRWFVEGFATFTERLPVAARLLQSDAPARTGNVILPRDPSLDGLYYRGDVPLYLWVGPFFLGYEASAWVFDYFADHAEAAGRDWTAAVRAMLPAGSSKANLDHVVGQTLGGTDFGTLVTRGRLALFLDEYESVGLPQWTQFLQYQLRESRPPGQGGLQFDPRVWWPRELAGQPFHWEYQLFPGEAWGIHLDARGPRDHSLMELIVGDGPGAIVTVLRIR